jgi:hypothetical protein
MSKNTYPRKILTKSTTKFKENFWCELKLYGKAFGMDLVKFFVVMDGSKIFGMVYGEISGMELKFYGEIFGMVYGEIPGMELKFYGEIFGMVYGENFWYGTKVLWRNFWYGVWRNSRYGTKVLWRKYWYGVWRKFLVWN